MTTTNSSFPLIKVLQREGKLYAYDAKSHFLTEVTEELLDYIYNYNPSQRDTTPNYILKFIDIGVFSPGGAIRVTPPNDEIASVVHYEIENYFPRKFSLDITEECTLRCKYCFYTTEDTSKRRHSTTHMSEDIARKAIDYYYLRYASAVKKMPKEFFVTERGMLPPNLSWWGGEPLLQFDLIKKTKSYFESLNWSSLGVSLEDIQYSIVTNFTTINDAILDFLVNNNIYLSISLDGDEDEHNANRIFANGEGSFNVVIKNLQHLIDNHPNYVKKYVTLQSVLTDNTDENKVTDFMNNIFKINNLKERKIVNWSPNRHRIMGEFTPKTLTNIDSNGILTKFTNTLTELQKKCDSELEDCISFNRELYYDLLDLFTTEESLHFDFPKVRDIRRTFSCPLGSDTMFISTNGNIHACCKTDHSFPLGHVNTGLDAYKIAKLYELYFHRIEQQCTNCWAINFCKICPAFTCYNGKIILPKNHECEHIRVLAELVINKYLILSTKFENLYEKLSLYFQKRKKEFRIDSKPFNLKTISHEKN